MSMPSVSSIAAALALTLSFTSLIVCWLTSQKARAAFKQLEQRVDRIDRQLVTVQQGLSDVKYEVSLLNSNRINTPTASDTIQYLKAKREAAGIPVNSPGRDAQKPPESPKDKESTPDMRSVRDAHEENSIQDEGGADDKSSPGFADDLANTDGLEEGAAVPYSLDLVQRVYGAWCAALEKPQIPVSLDAKLAEYGFLEPAPMQGGVATHVIRDTSKIGEFIRFSAAGADVGVVLPNPTAHFTPVVAHLFPGLTRDAYAANGAGLIVLRPVSVKRRSNSEWEAI